MCRYQEKSPHLRNWGDYGPQLKKTFLPSGIQPSNRVFRYTYTRSL